MHITFGHHPIIQDVDLTVADGELVSILGPSGAGKTTILKAVAGLLQPARGEISINAQPVNDLPPEKRDAVMVFQKPLLFPFLNVEQNVVFGLRMRGRPGRQEWQRVNDMLELVQLSGLNRRKVHELSGGQQQRVSLARALVLQPAVLLLDEPLSNLDAALRQQMRELIKTIQEQIQMTMLFVTHDQTEALMLSHRVSVLLDGRLRQIGTPQQVFYEPVDLDVARFFGGCNFFNGRFENGWFHSDIGAFELTSPPGVNGHALTAAIRPEDIVIIEQCGPGIEAIVQGVNFEGSATRLRVEIHGQSWCVLSNYPGFSIGQPVCLHFPPEKIRIFPGGFSA